MREDKHWFAPKQHGYGAGLPIAWQGWALLGAYLLLMVAGGILLAPHSPALFFALVVPATIGLIVISKGRTRGGWRWRSGEEPEAQTPGERGEGTGKTRSKRR